ncbi:hypothetical protein PISMIDRAFT_17270 [Pisolithus microcarpus 441]|uniref:Uncharacterized protein n=1 Tax=Pisolithus microcarpus 441 TaxID=765257 RepID=A0A0C9YCP5_9AGAM|nr:hypothetical protein BKA83DRAFT_17270 [Pisolithus microcarpus]KIK14471.1 hypothetical protein PISMIDRAFT_17270 [Pisolithus microcarpus 441]
MPRSGPPPFPQATPTTLDPLPGTPNQFLPLPDNGRHAYRAADTSACLPAVGISDLPIRVDSPVGCHGPA